MKRSSPVPGYPKLAHYMGLYPESAMFRRFSVLNCQNLLYLQAELVHLEEKLRDLEAVDAASGHTPRSVYAKDWYWLSNSASEVNSDQLQTVLNIRTRLKEYSGYRGTFRWSSLTNKTDDTIIQQAQIRKLSEPRNDDIRSLQDWLQRPTMGNLALIGEDRNIWGELDEPVKPDLDLLTFTVSGSKDSFSRWFAVTLLRCFHGVLGRHFKKPDDPENGIVSYTEKTIQRYTSHVTTIVASLLPVAATITLRFVRRLAVQLILIALFSFLFTYCMALFTKATRGEIFIGTSTLVTP